MPAKRKKSVTKSLRETHTKSKSDKQQSKPPSEPKRDKSLIRIKKRYLDPFIPLWLAIIFFFIDSIVFQKPLPRFVAWLLIITPLLLLAISFFFFALRKQFPWLNLWIDPYFTDHFSTEKK